MTDVLICGICGRMGRQLVESAAETDVRVVCGVDVQAGEVSGIPVYDSFDAVRERVDCIIDFSNHALLPKILAYALDKRLPAVIATTGHTEAERAQMREDRRGFDVEMGGDLVNGRRHSLPVEKLLDEFKDVLLFLRQSLHDFLPSFMELVTSVRNLF